MRRILKIVVHDCDTRLMFEFYGCENSSRDTGCPILPNLMKPTVYQETYRENDEIFIQWRAHRPLRSVHPANATVTVDDISIGVAFDVISMNDNSIENRSSPVVTVDGYYKQPWSVTVRGKRTCTRHANACKGKHLSARLIFDLSYISRQVSKNHRRRRVWEQTYADLWSEGLQDYAECPACAVYAEAHKLEQQKERQIAVDSLPTPWMDSSTASSSTSCSDSIASREQVCQLYGS